MATKINTDIWGAESEWIDVNNPPTLPYNLSSYIAQSSLTGLQRMEAKIPYLKKATGATAPNNELWRTQWRGLFLASDAVDEDNEIEKLSVPMPPEDFPVVWGLGKNSPMANSYYVYPEYITGSNVLTEPAGGVSYCYKGLNTFYSPSNLDGENDWKNAKPIPFCFTSQQGSSNSINFRVRNYEMGVGQRYASAVNGISGNPILSFNYQNVVIYPLLIIAKENENSNYGYDFQNNVTIGAYFDGVNYDPDAGTGTPPLQQTYPYICCVYVGDIRIGANDGTIRSSNNGGSIFGGIAPGLFDLNEVQALEMEYKGQVRQWTTQLLSAYQGRNQFQAITKSILTDGIISGSKSGTTPISFQMQGRSRLDTPDKAWIALTADSTSPTLPIFFQNGHYEPVLRQRRNLSNPNASYTIYLDFIPLWRDATKEDVLKDVAYLGFWFSEDSATAGNGATGETCNSPLMHIPIFDKYGITTGEYKSGVAASLEDNAKWQDPFKDNPYKPGDGEHDNDDNDFGDLGNGSRFGRFPTYLKVWLTDVTEFNEFVSAVNDLYITDPDGVQQWQIDFKGVNPSDYIVAAYVAPFEIPKTSTTFPIQLGVVTFDSSIVPSGIMAYKYAYLDTDSDGNLAGSYDCGSVQIPAYYGDFRDYGPYTSIELYIPMCGTVNLDPEYFVGHSVNVQYFYDVYTMSLSAGIYRDGITLYKVVNGVAGSEIPLTALRMGDYQNAVHNIEQALKRNEMSTAFGALTLGASAAGAVASGGASLLTAAGALTGSKGIIQGLDEREDLYYNLNHKQPSIAQTNAVESQNSFCVGGVYPHIFIKRAKMAQDYDANTYSHTVGNACIIQSLIGDMSGLIRCSNVDLSGIPATADEITAINTALKSGIYV